MNGDTLMIDHPPPAGQAPPCRNGLSPDDAERFAERAGIAEYDGGLPRAEAEQLAAQEAANRGAALPILTYAELVRRYPERRPFIIDGLLRQGETMNVIAAPKVGKSWLTLGLAIAVATGQLWLGKFPTRRGRVLIIDNELHPETSAHRLRMMAQALQLPEDAIANIDIVNLRGRLKDLYGLGAGLKLIERGTYILVIIDAFYRTLPLNTDENDNAAVAGLYNLLDSYADALGAGFTLVHHSSKGNQSGKSVTDVGAGAGAQSRAADTHVVLRPHEEDNAVVLDAAARSWPPVPSLCLRWDFPVWSPAPDLDPAALRPERPRRRTPERQEEPHKSPAPPWTAKRFAEAFGKPEPQARGVILETALLVGLSDRKATELLKRAIEVGYLHSWRADGQANRLLIATVPPPEPPRPTSSEGPATETPSVPSEAESAPSLEKKPRKAPKRPAKHPRGRAK